MNTKKELKNFFIWLRNGTCFAVTWFLILELIVSWISGTDTISVVNLTKKTKIAPSGAIFILFLLANLPFLALLSLQLWFDFL